IDKLQKRQTNNSEIMHSYKKNDSVNTEETPESMLNFNEETKVIYNNIQQLRENYRDVIILRSIQDLSVTETARVLKWSESKVTSTHYRARIALIEKIRRFEEDAK